MVKIVIVDDNMMLRNNLEQRLKPYADIKVTGVCVNGLQFLKFISEATPETLPEVVLMDIQMDVMDGIEATRQAKDLFPQMQFIMLTVADDDDHIFRAIQAGASGYLLKEESAITIAKAIRGTVAGEAFMSPAIAKRTLELLRLNTGNGKAAKGTIPTEPIPSSLSKRETEILELLTAGYTYQVISDKLFISTLTVQTHVKNIYTKLHVNNKIAAVKMAMDRKWFNK